MNKSLVLIAVAMVVCLSHVTVLHAVKANRVSNNKISSCLSQKAANLLLLERLQKNQE